MSFRLEKETYSFAGAVGVEPTTNGLEDEKSYELLNLIGHHPRYFPLSLTYTVHCSTTELLQRI
mgnify:CR=1 FL=1